MTPPPPGQQQNNNKRCSTVSFNDATLVASDRHHHRQKSNGTTNGNKGLGQNELTVCDITGDWGPYQWSLCLFASIYSASASCVVVFGPLLTPAMGHTCNSSISLDDGTVPLLPSLSDPTMFGANSSYNPLGGLQQCFKTFETDSGELISQRCTSFIYDQHDEQQYGLLLTNKFDLVCDHQWLRSLVSSASLTGMLLSSVTLGLFSDKFGRLRCLQLGVAISCLANVVAIFSPNYYLFCVCIMLMSFAQVGAANSLCTMLMEATSPRFRFVPMFEYGIGWGMGMMAAPLLNNLTHDYRWLMGSILAWQLLMLPWLHWGVSESMRWLLSEGHFNRAQIELRRAYRLNRVAASAQLAQDIAHLQAQQVRKASRVIEAEMAPVHLARAMGTRVDETARELDMLSAAIKKSFFGTDDNDSGHQNGTTGAAGGADSGRPTPSQMIAGRANRLSVAAGGDGQQPSDDLSILSPTLARASFSLAPPTFDELANGPYQYQQQQLAQIVASKSKDQLSALIRDAADSQRRDSITTQGLIQLAIKYSKTVQRSDEGKFFLVQMFHRKLWRHTVVLLCISVMYETSYYGFLQASKFVGTSIDLNFVIGGLTDWLGAGVATLFLAYCSRKLSLITTTLIGSLLCLAMAVTYQLIPDVPYQQLDALGPGQGLQLISGGEPALGAQEASQLLANLHNNSATAAAADSLIDNEANLEPISSVNLLLDEIKLANGSGALVGAAPSSPSLPSLSPAGFGYDQVTTNGTSSSSSSSNYDKLIELRHTINFYLMHAGKFTLSVGIQVAATIALEVYPNNLRQTGSGAILFAGRTGSILAPFLYNDPSADKWMLKLTLVSMAAIGLIVCLFVPVALKDHKDKELCDQMDEIDDDHAGADLDSANGNSSSSSKRGNNK